MEEYRMLTIMAVIFLGFPVYFLPAYIAAKRYHPKRRSILLWNLLSAWTVLGWVVLLFLSAKGSLAETEKNETDEGQPV